MTPLAGMSVLLPHALHMATLEPSLEASLLHFLPYSHTNMTGPPWKSIVSAVHQISKVLISSDEALISGEFLLKGILL